MGCGTVGPDIFQITPTRSQRSLCPGSGQTVPDQPEQWSVERADCFVGERLLKPARLLRLLGVCTVAS